ncbi:MAG: glycoside hydrolase family 2 [Atopobium sp.]|nr:glycoside hydrolase family 2 [Atopobium sp.]
MLDIRRVLASAPKKHTEETLNSLTTVWGEALDPSNVLLEHPRPRMQRDEYAMLNGVWEYAIAPVDGEVDAETLAQQEIPSRWDGQIVVPFSPEASLSGVGRTVCPHELLWYRRKIDFPKLADDQRFILHFDAVDWMCACFVNGKLVGTHTGGYLPFSFDITNLLGSAEAAGAAESAAEVATAAKVADAAKSGTTAELVLCVWDPSDAGSQLRGKQRLSRGDIWYTAQSGIWQSVWYEVVSAAHLESLTLKGDMYGVLEVKTNVQVSGQASESAGAQAGVFELELSLKDEFGQDVLLARLSVGEAGEICANLQVDEPQLWSPERPYLYFVEAKLLRDGAAVDFVRSYCAFHTVEVKPDEAGVSRVHLNGAPYFVCGVLDQGYWPDGLLTAPSDDALVYDVEAMKSAGFNTLRKHIKIESERWYYHCDRIGMLVWQDCVSGGSAYSPWHTSQKPTLFSFTWGRFDDTTPSHHEALSAGDEGYRREWTETCQEMVKLLGGHPSIGFWTLFNEGWGQFDARAATEAVRALDATRPIDATSGWYDQGCGDFLSIHNYFRPLRAGWSGKQRENRAVIISEFGGLAQMTPGHTSLDHSYGYGDFVTVEDWRGAVQKLLSEAESLQVEGLAGYVYTQVSDVEEEVNGLLTYDRKINKFEG